MPPSVASSSSTLVNAPVSLPLAKLSYCTTATLSSHMQWIHLTNQNDLFAVFDTTRRLDMSEQISEKHVLKLVNGKDLLVGAHQRPEAPPLRHLTRLQETVELETLRDQVRYDNERLRIQGVSDVERYMIIMVKRPLLAIAIRFRTAERMIRKIQMNFKPGNGYDHALEFLQVFGLPIKDTVASARSTQLQSQCSQSTYPHLAQPVTPQDCDTFRPTNESGPVSQSQSSLPPYPFLSQPRTRHISDSGNFPSSWVASSAQPPRAVSRPQITSDRGHQNTLDLPTVRSPRALLKETLSEMEAFGGRSPNPPPPDTARSCQSNQASSEEVASRERLPVTEVSSRPVTSNPLQWRPVSAAETQHPRESSESYGLSQMLPPQRKLPFPEKKVRPPTRASDHLVAASEDVAHNPKPARKQAATRKKAPNTGRAQSVRPLLGDGKLAPRPCTADVLIPNKTAEARSLAQKQVKSHTCSVCGREFTRSDHLRRHMATHEKREGTTAGLAPVERKSVVTSLPIMNDVPSSSTPTTLAPGKSPSLENPTVSNPYAPTPSARELSDITPTSRSIAGGSAQVLTEKSCNDQNRIAQAAPASPTSRSNPFLTPIQPVEFMASLDTWIRNYHHLPCPISGFTAADHLAEYAGRNDEERSQVIENMICECLQDENFGKLAEDVERTWRRIGLGF